MDPIYMWLGVTLLGLVPTYLMARWKKEQNDATETLKKNTEDKEKALRQAAEDKDAAHKDALDGLGIRLAKAEDHVNAINVQLERRVTWDEIGEIKKELKDDMEKVALRMEAAINSLRKQS